MKVRHKRPVVGSETGAASTLSVDSVRIAAESVGVSGLPDDAARELAEQTTYRLRQIIQDAVKFKAHGKRKRLRPRDVDNALRVRNLEPLYGISCSDHVPFRFTSGGGRELSFHEEKEFELSEVIASQMPKAPLDTSIKVHWLCIDGVQPAIPENPPPKSSGQQKQEATNPAVKGSQHSVTLINKTKTQRARTIETVSVKQLAQHELSVELQLYYKEITEACVGSDEARRAEALQSLSSDPGLHQMLPRLCNFIFEGVKVNVVQFNLALLIYLMRMVKALLDNQTLFLEKYLHEIIPSVASCIVSRQLCARPEADNHWALRDFASRLLALVSKQFNTSTNNVQTRITRLFVGCLENAGAALAAHYGALAGLIELGPEVMKAFVVPQIGPIGQKIDQLSEPNSNASPADRKTSEHFKELLKRKLAAVLASCRPPPDVVDEFRAQYGTILGSVLYAAVVKERLQASSAAAAAVGAAALPTAAAKTTKLVTTGPRTIVLSGPSRAVPPSASTTASSNKYVILGGSNTSSSQG